MPSDESIVLERADDPRARRYVESLLDWKRNDPGVQPSGSQPAIRSTAIVGMGMMGTAIAAIHVKHGLPVLVTDVDGGLLASAGQRIAAELDGLPEPPQGTWPEAVRQLVRVTTDEAAVAQCDLVLESIVETPLAKHQLYSRLEPQLRPAAILASNTSTIPIGRLAAKLRDPGRFCGLHFFHPVRSKALVEVVRGPQTNAETVAAMTAYAKTIGKVPIVVADGPGFLVNRLLMFYLNEALELLLDGASVEQIDAAAVRFGMSMGPIRFIDEIGLDTALLSGMVLREAFPERIPASPLLIHMIKAGRLGRKSGAGFFSYALARGLDEPGRPDPGASAIVARWARAPQHPTPATMVARMILPMILEATRILEEKRVGDPRDIDVGVLFGLGFPKSRGGLLHWADSLGADRVVELLKSLEPLGERARTTPLLLEIARTKGRFASLSRARFSP